MGAETPLDNPDSLKVRILYYIELFMVGAFSLEAVIRIISLGFLLNGETSYLRSIWNLGDFLVVIASIVSVIV